MSQSKLFVIGIGGSGARVIRSCVMLLASGVTLKNVSEVVFVLIDPDKSNGDLNRTIDILKKYQQIRKKLKNFEKNHFFQTKVSTLNELSARKENPDRVVNAEFKFNLMGVEDERFKDFIDFANLDAPNQAMISALFSQHNLDSDMHVGFRGNPNIGSVVLNQFKNSDEFKSFASNFGQHDRIFIISSIFGGTGAAGFPLLLKNIRNAEKEQKVQNSGFLTNAAVGALTILPYFGVEPSEESQIDKSTFMSKTKAALNYYIDNILRNRSINALYMLGDHTTHDYENHEGSLEQKNDAHFIEFAGAMAMLDFAGMDQDFLLCDKGKAIGDVFIKEFGVKSDEDPLTFKSLANFSNAQVQIPLVHYQYFVYYLKHQIGESIDEMPWSTKGSVKVDSGFIKSNLFYTDFLTGFNQYFSDWLQEMSQNKRAFSPFREVTSASLFQMVNGYESKGGGFMAKKNFALMDDQLNRVINKNVLPEDLPLEDKFMNLFSVAIKDVIDQKFKFS